MKRSKICLQIAAWSFILLGAGHLASHLSFTFSNAPKPEILQAMHGFIVPVPGSQVDLLSLHEGFSLMMGVLFMAFGTLNLLSTKPGDPVVADCRAPIYLNILVAAVAVLLSVRYFFIVPILLSGVSLACYAAALVTMEKPAPQ